MAKATASKRILRQKHPNLEKKTDSKSDHSHFMLIRDAYNELYKEMMMKGRVPYKDTGLGHWMMSASEDVYDLFSRLQLMKAKSFLDLGSGDGKVVYIASLFTKAHGIEHDDELLGHASLMRTRLLHVPHVNKATFMKGDFMQHDISKYDYVYWFPDKHHETLERKFRDQLKGKLIVHGPMHHPVTMRKDKEFDINGTLITVYRN